MQQRGQQRQERQRQRDLASEVVGTLLQLHSDLLPGVVILERQDLADPGIRERWEELKALVARTEAARVQLYALAARHPSDKISDLALKLSVALLQTLASVTEAAVSHLSDAPSSAEDKDKAEADHEKTGLLLDELLEAVRHNK